MEGKDTLMTREQLLPMILAKFCGLDPEMDIDWEVLEIAYKAQAEITWKAKGDEDIEIIRDTYNKAYEKGRKEGQEKGYAFGLIMGKFNGRREVVEIVNPFIMLPELAGTKLQAEWQAFLKKKGIEEAK